MTVEDIQSQIQVVHTRVAGAATAGDSATLVASMEEMSRIADSLVSANAEVERRLAIQYAVMRALAESIGATDAYAKVLQAICDMTSAELGILWIYDSDTGLLRVESIWQTPEKPGKKLADVSSKLTLSPGEGLPGSVYIDNKPAWIPDFITHPSLHPQRKKAAKGSGLQSVLLFPICKEEEILGVIECFSRRLQEPTADLMDILDALGNQIGGFIERKHAEAILAVRVHQQAIVASIGQRALLGIEFQELLDEASALVALTLSVDFSKILERIPEEGRLLLRAGVGWKKGLVGHTYLDLGLQSQAGYSLSTNTPVIVSDLSKETRFQPSSILVEHGIVSGLSVIIPGRTEPFGILSAHSTEHRTFTEDDIHFLQAVAHVLAAAIQRQEAEEALRLSHNQIAIILDGIADGITAQNQVGKLIYANDAAARMVGYANADEFVNTALERVMPRFEMFDEQGAPLPLERLPGRLALRGETPPPLTIRFRIVETGEERWSVVKAQAVRDEDGQVVMAVNIFQDITDLKRTEFAQRLLAETSDLLDTSLDYEARLANLAELVVPRLADWCSVDILDENGVVQRVAVAHIDPAKVAWAHELQKRYPPDPNAPTGIYNIIRTGKAQFTPVITEEMLDAAVIDPERKKLVLELGLSSVIQVPLVAHGRVLGVLGLVWAESGHHYSPADLALAEDLAHRAAMALDNARLYAQAQRLNAELEQRVEKRTVQLQKSNLRLKDEVKERKRAEKEIRSLNSELEQRVVERTSQLENTNLDLQHEILEREQADKALQVSLERTRELYEISQKINLARTPDEMLQALLTSSYLKSMLRASIAIFDTAWREGNAPPARSVILTAWARDPGAELYIGREFTLPEYGPIESHARYEPMIIDDVRSDARILELTRQRMLDAGIAGSVIFPLIAGGERYGLLSLHFEQTGMLHTEDVLYLRGLVDQTAVAIHNFRLLQTEAEARREAEEANKLKMKFLAMISHELRTPLTSIKGFATTLLAEDVEWGLENQRDFIETIDVEADKLTDLIEQLLDLSRLEAGNMRIVTRPVSWGQVVSTALAQLQALTVNHQLVVEHDPDLPAINVDMARVAQVLTNLVNNAVKYSPPATVITVSARQQSDDYIKVNVSDQGLGIPVEARNNVFEAFRQLEREKGGTQGAGLGLAICRGLIEAHDGRIWVDDQDGPGTTISFTLPVARARAGAKI